MLFKRGEEKLPTLQAVSIICCAWNQSSCHYLQVLAWFASFFKPKFHPVEHLQLWAVKQHSCKSSRKTKQRILWVTFLSAHSPFQSFFLPFFGPFWWLKRYSGGNHLVKFGGFSEFLIYFIACRYISQFSLIVSFHISCVQGSQPRIFSSDKMSESFFWLLVSGKSMCKAHKYFLHDAMPLPSRVVVLIPCPFTVVVPK